MSFGAVIGAGSALVGAYMSKKSSDKQSDAAERTANQSNERMEVSDARLDRAIAEMNKLTPPNLLQYVEPYQRQVLAGTLSPEEAVFKLQQDTASAGISVPPELLSAQQTALNSIQRISTEGGMTAIDRAQLNDIQSQQAARSAAEQGAIIQDAQQRGIAGAGTETAARLLSQQASADRSATSGLNVAATAQQRALQAMTQAGNLAGSQRTQAVLEQQQVADARDTINRFNTSFGNQTSAANVAARNVAQAQNLANTQAVSNYNTQLPQLEAAAKSAAAQNQWTNTFNKATNISNTAAGQAGQALTANSAAQALAQTQQNNADTGNAAAISQLGSAAASAADAYGNYQDAQKKKNPDGTWT